MNKLTTIVIALTIFSCGQNGKLNYEDFVGKYYNGPNKTNYHDLLLRNDSTYIAHMSYQWGDNMFEFAGQWTIIDDTIVLFLGNDFSENLEITNPSQIISDTLTLYINGLLAYNPNIKLSAYDEDLMVSDEKIKLSKVAYTRPHFKNDDGFFPTNIDLRLKNGFARINYFKTDKDMVISIANKSAINVSPDTVLCKYFMRDSILFSTNEHWSIERHSLKKEK